MRTKSLREALMNLAEEAAELSAAAARVINKRTSREAHIADVFRQYRDVITVMQEVSEHINE